MPGLFFMPAFYISENQKSCLRKF